ncbi:MAG TPA: proline dehydrogenase family protein [Aggregatilinea sp.]|uniref:proline dehydrogenase family protein n=1 Tax=Aggregatilinea sp. TaxID=2806333 RepID=UPI002BC0366F|nr:proline dehydrogenase family protein [Aggregatilinea sp.]HML22369.1 proline dehydrogenase family protein [Aggregatilinea sp.]
MSESGIGLKSRLWQQAMIRAARSSLLSRVMQGNPLTHRLSRRYVGGGSRVEALDTVRVLAHKGLHSSPYYLGEYVDTPELVERNVREILDALAVFDQAEPPAFFSIDPTQIGYTISDELGRANALRIAEALQQHPGIWFIMVDMEDASYVERTIALYETLREAGAQVAITLQAYLYRTEQDFERLASQGARIRLVKGAFVAGKDIAYTQKSDIDAAYERIARRALEPDLKAAGAYPIFATHDDRILDALKPVIRANGWTPDQYEIEMLLGVREPLQRRLAQEGHIVRVYVPFGTAWWAYTVRRVGENPANARFVLQALWGR